MKKIRFFVLAMAICAISKIGGAQTLEQQIDKHFAEVEKTLRGMTEDSSSVFNKPILTEEDKNHALNLTMVIACTTDAKVTMLYKEIEKTFNKCSRQRKLRFLFPRTPACTNCASLTFPASVFGDVIIIRKAIRELEACEVSEKKLQKVKGVYSSIETKLFGITVMSKEMLL